VEEALRARLGEARSVLILADGAWDDPAWMRGLAAGADLVLAADGAANACRLHGLAPHAIVGDLDSVTPETLAFFGERSLLHREPDQDAFDLEKCLGLVLAHAPEGTPVKIAGAFGGRLDHTLANLMLLSRYPSLDFSMEDARQRFFFVSTKKSAAKNRLRAPIGTPVSLLPFGVVLGVEARGLRYPVRGLRMEPDGLLGSSNEMAETEAEISLESGLLALVVQAP